MFMCIYIYHSCSVSLRFETNCMIYRCAVTRFVPFRKIPFQEIAFHFV